MKSLLLRRRRRSFFSLELLPLLLPLLSVNLEADAKVCPPCGSTTVPFPLSTAPDCGDQSYKIRCATATLFFDALNASSYPITSISPATQRLVILPPPSASAASCVNSDLASEGVHLNSSLPFNVSSSNTIMLLNCTAALLQSPLNCSADSLCHVYANATTDLASCRPLPICCTFVAGGSSTSHSILITSSYCSAYRSFVNLDATETPVARWGQSEGLELEWASPREPVCMSQADCEAGSNVTCRPDPDSGEAISRCFCVDGLSWDPFSGICVYQVTNTSSSSSNRRALIAGLVSGLSGALAVGTLCYLLWHRKRRIREARARLVKEREEILNANNSSGRTAKNFTGKEIKKATANFSPDNLLGAGGFGDVYKGVLRDGTPVAVKCAKLGNPKSTDQVLNEVRILSQVNHRSLVRLLGCCVDLHQPIMVYEFIANGALYDHLHGLHPLLPWRRRLLIARQTAEGLAYLHSAAIPPIYHRDIKSSNILLDEKLDGKVSDFGLSRLAEPGISHISTCAQGTLGYLDPEYYKNYQLTDKSDVYSFGVVLLELLTAQKAIDFCRVQDDVNLAVHVQRMVAEERLMEVVEGALKEGASQVELGTMKAIGYLAVGCLEEKRQNRPGMKEVVDEIEYIISILDSAENNNNITMHT